MKISLRHLFLCAAAFSLALTSTVFAQDDKASEPPPPATPAEPSPAVTAPAATEVTAGGPSDQTTAPAAESQSAAPAVVVLEPAAEPKIESSEPPKLRRLDKEDEDPVAPKSRKEKVHERIEQSHQRAAWVRANRVNRDIVNVFGDSDLAKDEKVDNVVAIFGSSTAEGEVTDSVVSVFGNTHASGPVGDAVVAILGDGEVTGPVGDSVVVVLGNLSINSHVRGEVVTVLGDITFGPAAEVDGEVVCVGGTVTRSAGTVLHHGVQKVGMGSLHGAAGLKAWVRQCFLYGRPLAFGPDLMWAWWIALGYLVFYVVVALIFGKGVNKCTDTLEQRPGYSILTALLTVVLVPIATLVLTFTGVGVAVLPFLGAALFFASLFGKVVMRAWIGRRFTRWMGSNHPALAVLIGSVIVLLLYTVPAVGFILYLLMGWIGLGVVIYTLILGLKREKAAVPPSATPAPTSPVALMPAVVPLAAPGDPAAPSASLDPAVVAPIVAAPPIISASTLTRVGFWIRLVAAGLDAVLVGVALHLIPWAMRPSFLVAYAAYCVILWALKGTTIGGIVCSLKVVRLDDRPVDWMTAIVRMLGGFLSLVACGFGFIWVVFDDQRQSWHDKIAGTTIVRVPKGVSLV